MWEWSWTSNYPTSRSNTLQSITTSNPHLQPGVRGILQKILYHLVLLDAEIGSESLNWGFALSNKTIPTTQDSWRSSWLRKTAWAMKVPVPQLAVLSISELQDPIQQMVLYHPFSWNGDMCESSLNCSVRENILMYFECKSNEMDAPQNAVSDPQLGSCNLQFSAHFLHHTTLLGWVIIVPSISKLP